jgi:hypothetical protein
MIVGKPYRSEQLELPELEPGEEIKRADLVFYGVDHSTRSYVALVFVGQERVDPSTPRTPEAGYAGSFTIFGHGGCAGGEGHCEPVERPADPFDVRPPHQLEPRTVTLVATEAIRRLSGPTFVVTVIPCVPGADKPEKGEQPDLLKLEQVRLLIQPD